ncbi:unnamed protein product [Cylicostephanus goldi]|uniref:ZP domain-containing protein n=1 Tax=Cylicostephanus goldi TaxID=71465 RepID=A0A3P6Q9Z7_CYLGO|nr:unnamed protein product [Cylicostephanus goldi]
MHAKVHTRYQFQMKYIGILIWAATACSRHSIENEIVDCEGSVVGLTFKTKKPFSGRVYVHGMAGDEKCSKAFLKNRNQSRLHDAKTKGYRSSTVSFHGTFVTKADRAYRCICFFKNQKTLTNSIEMSPIGTTELLNTYSTPTCTYSIHSQAPDGPVVMSGTVGERIYHVWQCDSTSGFLVHSCSVSDGRGERVDLIDVDGCAIDPTIQPDVLYEDDKAIVEVFGYKFSDATVLNYECILEICRSPLECEGLTPPKCTMDQTNSASDIERVRRSRAIGKVKLQSSFPKS